MNRDITLFETSAFPNDALTVAANMAKAYAQRLMDFERCKVPGTLLIDKNLGGSLDAVKDASNATIRVKKAKRAFLQTTAGNPTAFPVDIKTRDQQVQSLKRQVENINPLDLRSNIFSFRDCYVDVVQDGWTLYIWPWPTNLFTGQNTTIQLDVVQWLPDYANGNDEDFLLRECLDWMVYQTALHANLFLKEDQRVVLSKQYADDLWKSVSSWNVSLVDSNFPVDLD